MDAAALNRTDAAEMRARCYECGIRDLCAAYADAARPTAGFWAGKDYR
ncbi:hypothetical protein M2317_001319 [Microbacterium sp. ZKA21]